MTRKNRKSSSRPILVTGSHRSCSSLVGRMIGLSPRIGYIHEPFNYFIGRKGICNANFDKFFTYITDENESFYDRDISRTISYKYNLLSQLGLVKSKGDVKYLLSEYYHFLKYDLLNSRALVKDPFALFSSEWLSQKFDMDVIILIRHPMAFVNSLVKLNWSFPFSHFLEQPLLIKDYLYPFEDEINNYARKEQPLLQQATLLWKVIYYVVYRFKQKYQQWLYIRHEDLASEPEAIFFDIFSYLKIDYTEHLQKSVKEHCCVSEDIGLDSNPYLLKRDSRATIGSWKSNYTDAEISGVRSQVEEVSQYFYTDLDW
jgi:Sulfotransferase family